MLDDIPAPLVLRAERVSRDDREDMTAEDHRSQAALLDAALHESCAYAQQLWNDLAAARKYLYDSLPDEPSESGAAPFGPDDAAGWERWEAAFAEITTVLCGPHGDSGFGRSSATVLAQHHRGRVAVPRTESPEPAEPPEQDPPAATSDRAAAPSSSTVERVRDSVIAASLGAVVAAFVVRRRGA